MPAFTRSELADLNVFTTIVRRRSFRQAAIELGLTTSALSHSMKNLEARLGVKLLNRTSRSVVPTSAGSALAEELERGFQAIGDALGISSRYRGSPAGRLRINVPRDASRLLLGPVLPRFFANLSGHPTRNHRRRPPRRHRRRGLRCRYPLRRNRSEGHGRRAADEGVALGGRRLSGLSRASRSPEGARGSAESRLRAHQDRRQFRLQVGTGRRRQGRRSMFPVP